MSDKQNNRLLEEALREMDKMVADDPRIIPCSPKVWRIFQDAWKKDNPKS